MRQANRQWRDAYVVLPWLVDAQLKLLSELHLGSAAHAWISVGESAASVARGAARTAILAKAMQRSTGKHYSWQFGTARSGSEGQMAYWGAGFDLIRRLNWTEQRRGAFCVPDRRTSSATGGSRRPTQERLFTEFLSNEEFLSIAQQEGVCGARPSLSCVGAAVLTATAVAGRRGGHLLTTIRRCQSQHVAHFALSALASVFQSAGKCGAATWPSWRNYWWSSSSSRATAAT